MFSFGSDPPLLYYTWYRARRYFESNSTRANESPRFSVRNPHSYARSIPVRFYYRPVVVIN